jgi:hypothetical protein
VGGRGCPAALPCRSASESLGSDRSSALRCRLELSRETRDVDFAVIASNRALKQRLSSRLAGTPSSPRCDEMASGVPHLYDSGTALAEMAAAAA